MSVPFSAWSPWNAAVVDQVIPPDGMTTFAHLTFSTAGGEINSPAFASTNGSTDSVCIKQGTQGTKIQLAESATYTSVTFDFAAPAGNFQALPNGWFNVSFTDKATASHSFRIKGLNAGDNFYVATAQEVPIAAPTPAPLPAAAPVPAPVTTWTLNPWVRPPFAASSPINTPLPANPTLTPLAWPVPTGGNYWNIVKFTLDEPAANAPVVAVNLVGPAWQYQAGIVNRQMTKGFDHIPNASDTDNEVMSRVGNSLRSYWLFNRQTDTTATCSAYGDADLVLDSGFGTLPRNAAGVLATGQSCMAGALFKEEFTAGEINHVTALCVLFNLVGGGTPTPPAIGNDGSSSTGIVKEGDLLAIPRSTVMPSTLSIFGQKLFRAWQNYGVMVCDVGGATQLYLGTSYNTPAGSWTYNDILGSPNYTGIGLYTDVRTLVPMLQKVSP